MNDPVKEVKQAAKKKRRQPSIVREAKEAVKQEEQKSQKPQSNPPQEQKKQAPRGISLKPNPNPSPSLNPNPSPSLNLNPNPQVEVLSAGQAGVLENDDGDDGKIPFTLGVPPEEEEPVSTSEQPQDPVAILTGLVDGLANQVGALMRKVSGHDQMINLAQQILQEQGIELPPMGPESGEPAGVATEEGGLPKQDVPSEPLPKWQVGIQTLTEFMKHAKDLAGQMGSGEAPVQSDPFAQAGDLLAKVFDIEDKIAQRASRTHEANLKSLSPVIAQVVRDAVKGRVPETNE